MKKVLLLTLLGSLCFAANTQQPMPRSTLVQEATAVEPQTFMDANKTIVIKSAAPVFNIRLQSNRTTGYSWFITGYDRKLIKLVKYSYVPPTSDLVGAPGFEQWQFTCKHSANIAPSVSNINLVYARPWEINAPAKSIKFTVVTSP